MNETIDWLARARQRCIVDMGQIPDDQRRKLDRAARRGEIAKWRGYWQTFSPHFGMGPLKTCFGPCPYEQAVEVAVAEHGCVSVGCLGRMMSEAA